MDGISDKVFISIIGALLVSLELVRLILFRVLPDKSEIAINKLTEEIRTQNGKLSALLSNLQKTEDDSLLVVKEIHNVSKNCPYLNRKLDELLTYIHSEIKEIKTIVKTGINILSRGN